jgi:hypothetical protein
MILIFSVRRDVRLVDVHGYIVNVHCTVYWDLNWDFVWSVIIIIIIPRRYRAVP